MRRTFIITNRAVERINAGHLWLDERDLEGRPSVFPCIATILDRRHAFVATAFVSPGSLHPVRIITRREGEVDGAYWRALIRRAYERRMDVARVTNAFRVVHAEADGIPSVVIDKYDDTWAIQINTSAAELIKTELVAVLKEEFNAGTIVEKNSAWIRKQQGLPTEDRVIVGSAQRVTITEYDQRFELDVMQGQKTGAYLDYRNFRRACGELARGYSLDLFCYQGWCSCHMAVRADRVLAVDASESAIRAAAVNAALNRHGAIEFVVADAFDYLQSCGGTFDFIHIDPPAMSKGRGMLKQAKHGYRRLIDAALERLADGGVLLITSCSHSFSEGVLENTVRERIAVRGGSMNVVFRGIQDKDHPVLAHFSESLYLKGLAVEVHQP